MSVIQQPLRLQRGLLKPFAPTTGCVSLRFPATHTFTSSCRRNGHPPIPVFTDIPPLRSLRRSLLVSNKSVGFVPTMGALHSGHLSLIRRALSENPNIFLSIFVNPTQFGMNEDLSTYPRTWDSDLEKISSLENEVITPEAKARGDGISGIFFPSVKTMYPTLPPTSDPAGHGSFINISPLGNILEGKSRPVFFRGVATVCAKLFNAVQPDTVYFGQKDVQQSVLIKRMVRDFHFPISVVVVATEREPDGLAMSSRNVYLGSRRREDSLVLSKALRAAEEMYENGETAVGKLRSAANRAVENHLSQKDGMKSFGGRSGGKVDIDYIAFTGPEDMVPMGNELTIDPEKGAIVCMAVNMGPVAEPKTEEEKAQKTVRLIDNVILKPKAAVTGSA